MGTLAEATRNAMVDAACAQVNGGNLVIMTSGDAEVATLPLSPTAFGNAVTGQASANAITDDDNATGGTAALHKFETSGNAERWRGTVGTSSAELILSTTTIPAGAKVSVSSYTFTQPAS